MAILQSIVTVVIFLAMLGALVIFHELGHFVTARLARIRVHEFGIGFPPRAKVLSSHGETLYTLNWLPIGGFVRLEGEDGDSDDPRSFTRAWLPVKLIVLLAGVAMNLLLAVVIFTATAWFPGQAVELQFQTVQPDSPAAAAGLQAGEAIVSIDGRHYDQFRVDGPEAMVADLRAEAGQTVTLGILGTNQALRTVTVTLRNANQIDDTHGALGITQLQPALSSIGFTRSPLDAARLGVARTVDAFQLILGGLGDIANSIATHPTQAPPASGPVGIAVQVGDVFWQAGPLATLYLAGILSANLALVNILPFPPLDGGRMLMIVIKSVVGTRISIQAERLTYLVGFGFLFAFLIWITYFDIARLGSGAQ
jgi:regulator of sigma E protease